MLKYIYNFNKKNVNFFKNFCSLLTMFASVVCYIAALQRMEVEVQPEDMPKEKLEPAQEDMVVPEVQKTEEVPVSQIPDEASPPEESVAGSAPEFTELLRPVTVHDAERVELKVTYRGVPSPSINWYFNGGVIKPNQDFQITVDIERQESTLVIVEVFPEDEGEYTCIAVNPFGETMTTCRLTVISKSWLTVIPAVVMAMLTCMYHVFATLCAVVMGDVARDSYICSRSNQAKRV